MLCWDSGGLLQEVLRCVTQRGGCDPFVESSDCANHQSVPGFFIAGNKINYINCFSGCINIVQPKFQRGFTFINTTLKTHFPFTTTAQQCSSARSKLSMFTVLLYQQWTQSLFFSHISTVNRFVWLHITESFTYRRISGQIWLLGHKSAQTQQRLHSQSHLVVLLSSGIAILLLWFCLCMFFRLFPHNRY